MQSPPPGAVVGAGEGAEVGGTAGGVGFVVGGTTGFPIVTKIP